jgi:hypothetical protein
MIGHVRALTIVAGLVLAACGANLAFAQKSGGILKISFFDNPASMSLGTTASRLPLPMSNAPGTS